MNKLREELAGIIATRVRRGCEQFSKLINGKVSEGSYKTEWLKLDTQALDAIEKIVDAHVEEKYKAELKIADNRWKRAEARNAEDGYITKEDAYEKALKAMDGWWASETDIGYGMIDDALRTAFEIGEK